ncbi:MAG TPA: hypothetical protein VF507_06375, partial [Pyrinomonadaceae bacterium]
MLYSRASLKRRLVIALALTFLICATLPFALMASAKLGEQPELGAASVTGLTSSVVGAVTHIQIQGTAPLAYSVSRPDAQTVLVDLLGADASRLERSYPSSSPLVERVLVEREFGPAPGAGVRLRIVARAPVRERVRAAGRDLIIELSPSGPAFSAAAKTPAPAPVASEAPAKSAPAQTAPSAAAPASAPVVSAPAVNSTEEAAAATSPPAPPSPVEPRPQV